MAISSTVRSLPIKALYETLLERTESELPNEVKDKHAAFLREFSQFFRSHFHDQYLSRKKSDGETIELICSICSATSPARAALQERQIHKLSFPTQNASLEIACCQTERCARKVDNYFRAIEDNIGPFPPGGLLRVRIDIDSFGREKENFCTLRVSNDALGWRAKDMEIKYSPKSNDLEVMVGLDRRNRSHHIYTQRPLKDMLFVNPEIDFSAMAQKMPNTLGGRFIASYIEQRLNPSIPLRRLLSIMECPISYAIMKNPVIGSDGHTYEQEAIDTWRLTKNLSPISRQPIDRLVPNYLAKAVRDLIKEQRPDLLK
jgi:hypothetical protein